MLLVAPIVGVPASGHAQQLDLSHGGPIQITASNGIEWRQAEQEIIASGDARAVRAGVTVTANRLIAWYRKRNQDTAGQPSQIGLNAADDTSGDEIYRLRAEGNVHIYTKTDQAQGDRATYDIDTAVLVMTGRSLKLTTPNDILTARDTLEYWSQKHMAIARGDAVVVTNDGRRLAADTLVAYTTDNPPPNGTATKAATPSAADDPITSSGKLEKVEAFGNVSIRTATDTVTGDRGVYVPETGMARLGGGVRITRGQNQLNGAEAIVDMKSGVARLVASTAGRVQGLVVPNDQSNQQLSADPTANAPKGQRP
jgi:lipopolysaccharide export system protein LptA